MMLVLKLNLINFLVVLNLTKLIEAAWLRCYKGSLDDFIVAPLTESLSPSFISCIDPDLPTIAYTFGFRGRVKGPATTAVLSAYLATKKRNVLLLDWEEEAQSGLLGLPLSYALYAVPKAIQIGKQMGDALVRLSGAGINMTSIHLVGHSLGAHMMGYAGKQAREKGYTVARITGLDPARALFEGTLALYSGLDRTCARFVDTIHSDPGGYGTSSSIATVDIWPNYEGKKSTQPGCDEGEFEMFSREDDGKHLVRYHRYEDSDNAPKGTLNTTKHNTMHVLKNIFNRKRHLCSHDRSWRFYVEAIGLPTSFPAVSAPDYETWANGGADTNRTTYLGELTNTRAQGNFYLVTNPVSPYGKRQEGLQPIAQQARVKRSSVVT
uniref:Lipase domain-containing protein n=1 Tax=Bombyx mori TaxID=7091 RepID=A0A8R2C6D8_BOMMO|nr:vitellogenin-2 isoform X1 [Bombyx mori]